MNLANDPGIPLLGIDPRESKAHGHTQTCPRVLTAAWHPQWKCGNSRVPAPDKACSVYTEEQGLTVCHSCAGRQKRGATWKEPDTKAHLLHASVPVSMKHPEWVNLERQEVD